MGEPLPPQKVWQALLVILLLVYVASPRARTPIGSLAQPRYVHPETVDPTAKPESELTVKTAGFGALAGQTNSARVASCGPGVMVMQPGSLSIMPWTGSSISGRRGGQSVEKFGSSMGAKTGHSWTTPSALEIAHCSIPA